MTDIDPRERLSVLCDRLESGERYVQFDPDRQHLLRMVRNMRLVPSEIGPFRQAKVLRHCSRMAALAPPPTRTDFEVNDEWDAFRADTDGDIQGYLTEQGLLGGALEYRAVAEAIVEWIHDEYDNEHTNQDYRTALRSFGRYRLKREEPPESLAWIPTGTSNDFNPVPSERDLLTWDGDVKPMLEATLNERDAALIALQFEAGLRGGELYDLQRKDLFDAEHSMGVHSDGKQGEHPVHLIVAVPYIQQWLEAHPSDDPEAYLWSKLDTPERPSYPTFLNYFKSAAERAGVDKDVTPTAFRKSNMRWLVKRGLSQPEIEDRQGRVRGSDETARYMARFSEESLENRYARAQGLDVGESEPGEVAPIECPRCEKETPRDLEFCMHCAQTLDLEAKEVLDAAVRRFDEQLVEADDPDEREDLIRARRTLTERPNLMDQNELRQLASSLDVEDASSVDVED